MKNCKFFDNGGKTFDRLTLINLEDTFSRNGEKWVQYVGSSATGLGFWQHGEMPLKNAVASVNGKKIEWSQLDPSVQKMFLSENPNLSPVK